MKLEAMKEKDRAFVMGTDIHMDLCGFKGHVHTKTGYVMWEENEPVGLMHYCVIWDRIPFLNCIIVLPEYRHRGYGSAALDRWEQDMRAAGHKMVMVSTQADEDAQTLYRKLGYVDCGVWIMDGTPFPQPAELFLRKVLEQRDCIAGG